MPDPKPFLTDEEMAALSAGDAPPEFIPDEPASQQAIAAGISGDTPAKEPLPAIQPNGRGEALARGGLQGISLGFGDELAAIPAALMGGDPLLGVTFDAPTFGERRQQAREYFAAKNRGARAEYPGTYFAGQVAGGAALPGAASIAGVGQLSNAARIASLAGSGATLGAISGAGSAEPGERTRGAATGAIMGALVAPAVDTGVRALAAASGTAAEGFRRAAGYAASRIGGGIQRDVSKVGGALAFSEAGNEAVERGLIKPWDFLWGAGVRQEQRIADFAQQSTDEITQALDQVGARVPLAPLKQALLDSSDELRQFAEANPGALAKVDGIISSLEKQADAAGTVSARTLQSAKKVIDDFTKTWDPFAKSSLAQNLNKAMYGAVAEAQEQAVETAGSATGRAAYEAAKKASALARKLEIFQESAARREANALSTVGGLPGSLGALSGIQHFLSTGDLTGGLGTYVATRVLTSPRTAAIGLRGAQRLAEIAPAYARSPLNPLVARSAAQAIVSSLQER